MGDGPVVTIIGVARLHPETTPRRLFLDLSQTFLKQVQAPLPAWRVPYFRNVCLLSGTLYTPSLRSFLPCALVGFCFLLYYTGGVLVAPFLSLLSTFALIAFLVYFRSSLFYLFFLLFFSRCFAFVHSGSAHPSLFQRLLHCHDIDHPHDFSTVSGLDCAREDLTLIHFLALPTPTSDRSSCSDHGTISRNRTRWSATNAWVPAIGEDATLSPTSWPRGPMTPLNGAPVDSRWAPPTGTTTC